MIQLTEETYKDFIKDGKKVIRTWDEGCSYCVKYEPIFDEYVAESGVEAGTLRLYVLKDKKSSEFKRTYMKQDKSEAIKETVPGTFVFENGELKARHFGTMTKEELKTLVETYTPPQVKQNGQNGQVDIKKLSSLEIEAMLYREFKAQQQANNMYQHAQNNIQALENELASRK